MPNREKDVARVNELLRTRSADELLGQLDQYQATPGSPINGFRDRLTGAVRAVDPEAYNRRYGDPDQPALPAESEYPTPASTPQQGALARQVPSPQQGLPPLPNRVLPELNPEPLMSGNSVKWTGSGRVYTIQNLRDRAPEELKNASDEQLLVKYAETIGADPFELAKYFGVKTGYDRGLFSSGFSSGFDQIQGLGLHAAAAVADLVGADRSAESLRRSAEDQQYQGYIAGRPELDDVTQLDSFTQIPEWAWYQLGKQIPTMGSVMAAQFVPGIGQAATVGAMSTRAGLAATQFGLGRAAVARFGSAEAARQGLRTQATSRATAAQYAAGSTIGMGSLYEASGADGNYDAAAALAGAPVFGAFESLVPAGVTRAFRVPSAGLSGNRALRGVKGAGIAGIGEAGTEVAQTTMEILYDGTMTPEQVRNAYINAAAAGFVVGGAMGGVGGALQPRRNGGPAVDPNEAATPAEAASQPVGEIDLSARLDPLPEGVGDAKPVVQETVPHIMYRGEYVPVAELEGALERLEVLASGRLSRADRKAADAERRAIGHNIAEIDKQLNGPTVRNVAEQLRKDGQSRKNALRIARAPLLQKREELMKEREYLTQTIRQSDTYARAEAEASRIRQALEQSDGKAIPMPLEGAPKQATIDTAQAVAGVVEPEATPQVTQEPAVVQPEAQTQETANTAPIEAEQVQDSPETRAAQEGIDLMPVTRTEALEQTETPVEQAPVEVEQAPVEQAPRRKPTNDGEPVRVIKSDDPDLTDADRALLKDLEEEGFTAEQLQVANEAQAKAIQEVYEKVPEDVDTRREEANPKMPLLAAVSSGRNLAGGSPTLPVPVIQGITHMLRHSNLNPVARVFRGDGTVAIDPEASEQYNDQMQDIYAKALEVVRIAAKFNNLQANVLKAGDLDPTVNRVLPRTQGPFNAVNLRRARAMGAELNQAVSNFIDAAGGERNARAIIAAYKTRNEGDTSTRPLRSGKNWGRKASSLGKGLAKSKQALETAIDTNLSSALARYMDGSLLDMDTVNPLEVRNNYKLRNKTQPLTAIINAGGGITDVLKAVADWKGTNTPYTMALGKLIRTTIEKMENGRGKVQVKLFNKGESKPHYDPNDGPLGTIHLSRNATREEIMHEALHAALQWYVYENPTGQPIVELSNTIDAVIDFVDDFGDDAFVGMSTRYVREVKAVTGILKSLRDSGRDLDAALELISYGTTLRSFSNFLKGIKENPTDTRPEGTGIKHWVDNLLNKAWEAIRSLLQATLGVTNTMANSVLDNSIMLLEQAARRAGEYDVDTTTETVTPSAIDPMAPASTEQTPTALFHSLDNPEYVNGNEQPSRPDGTYIPKAFENASTAAAKYRTFGMDRLFKMIGWDKFFGKQTDTGTVEGGILQQTAKLWGEHLQKNHPGITRFISMFNSNFVITKPFRDILARMKTLASGDYLLFDNITRSMQYMKVEDRKAMLKYLDTQDPKVMANVSGAAKWMAIADESLAAMRRMVDSIPIEDSVVRNQFAELDGDGNIVRMRKFSETIINVDSRQAISSHKFGLSKLASQIKAQNAKFDDADFTAFRELLVDGDGQFNPNAEFYRVEFVSTIPGNGSTFVFVNKDTYDRLEGDVESVVDMEGYARPVKRNAIYRYKGLTGDSHNFAAKHDYAGQLDDAQALRTITAMRNTFSALANYYASKTTIENIAKLQGDPESMVFDTVAELNERLGNTPEAGNMFNEDHLKFGHDIVSGNLTAGNWKARAKGLFVRVPEGKGYGELGDKIIPAEMWVALHDAADRSPVINIKAYNQTLVAWKKAKTIYNPGTHITNAAANIILALFHGIPMRTVWDATKMLARFETNPDSLTREEIQLVMEFQRSGAMLGNFSNAELKRIYYKATTDAMSPVKEQSVLTRVTAEVALRTNLSNELQKLAKQKGLKGELAARFIDDSMIELYNMGDNVFRLAAFMTRAGDLMQSRGETQPSTDTMRDAGLYAKRAFIDYDVDAKAIKFLRQSFLPFVSYTYGIIPVLARLVATKPWLIANTMAAMALLDAAFSALADDDDDETRLLGPDNLTERMYGIGPRMYWRLPMFGDSDTPVYLNVGDYVPSVGMVRGGLPNSFLGQDWWPQGITPSTPLISAVFAMFGYDAFTGTSIHQPTDTGLDKAKNVASSLWTNMAPPTLSTQNAKRFGALMDGTVGPTGREPSAAMFMFSRVAGLKLQDFNVAEEFYYRQLRETQAYRDYRSAIKKAQRDEMRRGYPDYEALDKQIATLYERMIQEVSAINRVEE